MDHRLLCNSLVLPWAVKPDCWPQSRLPITFIKPALKGFSVRIKEFSFYHVSHLQSGASWQKQLLLSAKQALPGWQQRERRNTFPFIMLFNHLYMSWEKIPVLNFTKSNAVFLFTKHPYTHTHTKKRARQKSKNLWIAKGIVELIVLQEVNKISLGPLGSSFW